METEKKDDIYNFLTKARGISRAGLNIMCFIGAFIFGWLMAVVFNFLGKGWIGWIYVVLILIIFRISGEEPSVIMLIGGFIYIVGWIHANMLLSNYILLANNRIDEINAIPDNELSVNEILERGLLKLKLLRLKEEALIDFNKVTDLSGGDSQLMYHAGIYLYNVQSYQNSLFYFNGALENTSDIKLQKKINKYINLAKKYQK